MILLVFCLGIIGTSCEIISVIVLLAQFNDNKVFSYQITIVAVVLNIISCITCLMATLITINIIKDYKQRGNSII
ncbi:hypothetical protein [Spiroplasma endosymbiont of Melieria omissa]|uniref:hypothetical protein n=1 Tax=Spiroplasma endosymbiont of Melieria omissa TaxID=3139324 RepID=UPI003CCA95CA